MRLLEETLGLVNGIDGDAFDKPGGDTFIRYMAGQTGKQVRIGPNGDGAASTYACTSPRKLTLTASMSFSRARRKFRWMVPETASPFVRKPGEQNKVKMGVSGIVALSLEVALGFWLLCTGFAQFNLIVTAAIEAH